MFVVVLLHAPMANAVRTYLHANEVSVYEKLVEARVMVTRLSNERHRLNAYVNRMRWDRALRAVVDSGAKKNSHQRTPLETMRLKLTDGMSDDFMKRNNVIFASLDWIDSSQSQVKAYEEMTRIGLSARVHAVPHAIEFLNSIQNLVRPYPLQAHGCSYQRVEGSIEIEMSCLLTLTAWRLPLLNVDESMISLSSQALPVNPASTNALAKNWALFGPLNTTDDIYNVSSSDIPTNKIKRQGLKKHRPTSRKAMAQGVIIGPAGKLVIHASSQ